MDSDKSIDFTNPDYSQVYKERGKRLENIRANPEILQQLKQYYKTRPADFIDDWGMTFDPRAAEIDLPTTMPFILFPKQRQFIDWLYERWRSREDGLVEKSRDMGVSWLCVGFSVWMFLFHGGTVSGFGSRKEEYVDKLGDPKSLFWKVRQFIELLPPEFRPNNWNTKADAPYMRVVNPENESAIVGEAGTNIGRGNRTSIYFLDEFAYMEQQQAIDAAVSQTSNVKIYVSTPNGAGDQFYAKRHSGKVDVFTFHWQDDPRKDQNWYDKQKGKLDPVVFAQEIDIDYNASTADSFIVGEAVSNAQMVGPADVEDHGAWVVGIDAAHEGNDESVIHMRKGRLNLPQITLAKVDGIALAERVEAECHNLESIGSTNKVAAIVIELDGPGVSCYDQLKSGHYGNRVIGVHTGARLSDGRNYNIRAKLWRDAKEYLDGHVSMPKDQKLKSQLSSLKYKYKDGCLLMQSKKEYKKEYNGSPDRADAFILTFADVRKVEVTNRPMPTRAQSYRPLRRHG